MALYAGGITWVDEEYDEKLGAALRPLEQDFRGFNYGVQMNADTRAMLHRAFFLDALTPFAQGNKDETAYEVGQRCRSTSATPPDLRADGDGVQRRAVRRDVRTA
jgi:hypothetical protein